MLREIVVGSISNSLQLLSSEGKVVFDVVSSFRIKGALFIGNGQDVKLRTRDTNALVKFQALFAPVLQQLSPLLRPTEVFELHLFKFAGSKGEIARINFVPECLADLRNAERQLL